MAFHPIYINMAGPNVDMKRVEHWSPVHYAVLEFFDNHDIEVRPASIARNIGYSRSYVGKACRKLVADGILEGSDQYYSLTDFGRRFLAGDVSADEIERRG